MCHYIDSDLNSRAPRILLIGASRGIGLAMAEELLKRNWLVTATVRGDGRTALHELSVRYTEQLTIERLDITDNTQLNDLHSRLSGQKFEVLFINAGIVNKNQGETVGEVSAEEFIDLMITNALSPIKVAEALQDTLTPEGLVGIMSSGQASLTNNTTGGLEVYRASKAALNQFMRSYAIRQSTLYPNRAFLLLAPGWIRTDMGGSNGAFSLEEAIPDIIKTIEQKQGKPGLEYLDRFGKTIPW